MTQNRRNVLKGAGVALLVLSLAALGASGAAAQEGSADLVQRVLPNPNPEVDVALGQAARRTDVGLDRRRRHRPDRRSRLGV